MEWTILNVLFSVSVLTVFGFILHHEIIVRPRRIQAQYHESLKAFYADYKTCGYFYLTEPLETWSAEFTAKEQELIQQDERDYSSNNPWDVRYVFTPKGVEYVRSI